MQTMRKSISTDKLVAITATIISGLLALFVPLLSTLISTVVALKFKGSKEAWPKKIIILNVVIAIVNLVLTISAITVGSMLMRMG